VDIGGATGVAHAGGVAAQLLQDNDVTVATLENVVFVHWRGATLPSIVPVLQRAIDAVKRVSARAVFFAVIEPTSSPPDQATRSAFGRFFEDNADSLAAAVVTIHGEGFRAAMVRTISSAILTLMPRRRVPFPRHIEKSIEDSAQLAAAHTPGLDRQAIVSAFRSLAG
jgi:hypothetical protein